MNWREFILKLVVFLGLLLAGPLAVAGTTNTAYGSVGYSYWTIGNWHPTAWSLRGGYYFAPWLAGEMQFLSRASSDAGRFVDSGLGAYVRGELSLGRKMRAYALAGYAYTDVIFAFGTKVTYDHYAYGLGAQADLGKKTSLAIDYIAYNGDSQVNTISASLSQAF